MDTTIEIIGVYPINNQTPVHLVEIIVRNSRSKFELSEFTQEVSSQPKKYWQVPWDEKLLDKLGRKVIADDFVLSKESDLWHGDLRLIFFFHYLDCTKPLLTPFGPVEIPKEKSKPKRLGFIGYESPD